MIGSVGHGTKDVVSREEDRDEQERAQGSAGKRMGSVEHRMGSAGRR